MLHRVWDSALALLLAVHALGLVGRVVAWPQQHKPRFEDIWRPLMEAWDQPYNASEQKKNAALSKEMFVHAFNSYMSYGFPQDNVRPQSCRPSNSQGGIGLTLLDSLDSLLLFGMEDDFRRGLRLIEEHVHFNASTRVHVFELTIRALGGLLASHVAITDNPSIAPGYSGVLLSKAQSLAQQLLPAFNTTTGIPVSWVNLKNGRIAGDVEETCVACAVTLAVEFRLLSYLTGNSIYGRKVDHAVSAIFARREPNTHLVGNTLWTTTGEWERRDAGIGAGADSYYEYLLKTYLVFGDEAYLEMFVDQYASAQRHMAAHSTWHGFSWLLDIHMTKLSATKGWVSSLSAFWPALQASIGQLREAHMLFGDYIAAFSHFGWIPEQISVLLNQVHPSESAYPLRPEVVESALALWAASGEPRYQRAGAGILHTISTYNSAPCGYCSVQNIASGAMEDGMESFFLAETSKYLFLLFSNGSAVLDHYVLSTEGHLLPVVPSPPSRNAPLPPAHGDSAVAARVPGGTCPIPWRQQECAAVCEKKPSHLLRSEADAARAQFPALHFSTDSAVLLRQRRCRACRKVVDSLAVRPPPPPCLQAETLGVRLDRDCGAAVESQQKSKKPSVAFRKPRFARGGSADRLPPSKEELRFDVIVQVLRKFEAGEASFTFLDDAPAPPDSSQDADAPSSGTDPAQRSEEGAHGGQEQQAMHHSASCKPQAEGSSCGDPQHSASVSAPLQYEGEHTNTAEYSSAESLDDLSADIVSDLEDLKGGLKILTELRQQLLGAGIGADTDFSQLKVSIEIDGLGAVDADVAGNSMHIAEAELKLLSTAHDEAVQQLSDATEALVQAVLKASEEALEDQGGAYQGADTAESGGLPGDARGTLAGLISELRQLSQAGGGAVAEHLPRVQVEDACSGEDITSPGVRHYAEAHEPQRTCADEQSQSEAATAQGAHTSGASNTGGGGASEKSRPQEESPAGGVHSPKSSNKKTSAEEELVHNLLASWGIAVSFSGDETSAQHDQQAGPHSHASCEALSSASDHMHAQEEALGGTQPHPEALTCANVPSSEDVHDYGAGSTQHDTPPVGEKLVAYGICLMQATSDRGMQCGRTALVLAAGLSLYTLQRLMPDNIVAAQVLAAPRSLHNQPREQATVAVRMKCMHACTPSAQIDSSKNSVGAAHKVVYLSGAGAMFGTGMPQFPGHNAIAACRESDERCSTDEAMYTQQHDAFDGYQWLEQVDEHIKICTDEEDRHTAESATGTEGSVEPPAQSCVCGALPQLLAGSHHPLDVDSERVEDDSSSNDARTDHETSTSDEWPQGPLVLAEPLDACGDLHAHEGSDAWVHDAPQYAGSVVIAARGACSFHQKALNAQRSGAVGLIVANGPRPTLGRYVARWGTQGGIGWGSPHDEDDSKGADQELSPEVFLMASGGGEWESVDTHIPAVMLPGPQGAGLIATITCMRGRNTCVEQLPQHGNRDGAAAVEEAASAGGGTSGVGGVSDRCAEGLHAVLFSGNMYGDDPPPPWDVQWKVLMSSNANAWVTKQVDAGKLENQQQELSNALMRDLLPAINEWVEVNYDQFSSLPDLLPDDDPVEEEDPEGAPGAANPP